jgi:NAD(P)-dependent dehydrogenase (short-subunit alcohol dehydrogenase family)
MAINPFSGKIALVTGAASKRGMGHAVALRLAAGGTDVAILDKDPAPRSLFTGDEGWRGLDEGVEEIKAMGREVLALTADVSKSEEAIQAVEKVLKKFGRIDIFVHCAAIRGTVNIPVVDTTEEDWRKVVDVNLTGTFIISKQVAQHMIKRGGPGKMVLLSSVAGKIGVAGTAPYVASKWGILGLRGPRSLSSEKNWKRHGRPFPPPSMRISVGSLTLSTIPLSPEIKRSPEG